MTPPQEASLAPASEPAAAAGTAPDTAAARHLIAPEAEIFDAAAVAAELETALVPGMAEAEIRAATVHCLRDRMEAGRARIAGAFEASPRSASAAGVSYAFLTDGVLRTIFDVASERLHPASETRKPERLSVLAVGGYGRGEMAPFSDVDLLFLVPQKAGPRTEAVVEAMLYMLWDLHLKVGHATRSVRECIRLGREDTTIRTALLEHRHLFGDAELSASLDKRLWKELFKDTGAEFIEAKLAERAERHRKQGGQRYMVEPNVKEGKGGLRDLQTLYWIAKYVNRVETPEELLKLGTFTGEEFRDFERAESFLMAVRTHLHLIAGRAMDQLTFDMQVEVAARMDFRDSGGRRAVEHFMQAYFRHATTVGEVTRILLTDLEAQHAKAAPGLVRLLRRRKPVKEGYAIVHGRICYADREKFLSDKLNLLRIFEEGLRTGYLIHPDAMRAISGNLHLIDDGLRKDPEARRIFLDLLLKHGNPERALRRMNELGVLSAFIPDFAPIVAMMQFNMYHHYTVDEHTIQCIANLAKIERGELEEELPVASRILEEGVNRRVLYVALLCHDIGKGRKEDHSILGAQISRRVAPALGLKKDECETVEWLVRYHLLMSDMAQKRDLADPRTIRDFAKAVKTKKRLDLLTVLTVCDIRGVGPGTWNNWKAQLLRALYRETATALEHGLEELNRDALEGDARRALKAALGGWTGPEITAELDRHYGPYWQGMPTSAHAVFAELLKDLPPGEVRIDLFPDEDRDATRACFALEDHPGIFSRLAGALALVGANVVDARTYTTKDGYATSVFWIQDSEGSPYAIERLHRLRRTIERTLRGEVVVRDAVKTKDRLKKRERPFKVPTAITFDNEGSEIYTIIEVDTRDRPGLLYDLTRALTSAHVYINSAVIATYGEQAVDSFYVKDMFGLKYHSESKQRSLEKRLREAIARGAERARE